MINPQNLTWCTYNMEKIEYPEWLPDSVKKKCIPIIENDGMPSKHIEILTRLLTDPRMDKVYAALGKRCNDDDLPKPTEQTEVLSKPLTDNRNTDLEEWSSAGDKLVNHILAIMFKVIEVKSYSIFTAAMCKDKLESIAKKAQSIADDLMVIKKEGIVLPAHLEDPASFLLKFYQDKHESSPDNSFIETQKSAMETIKASKLRHSEVDLINAFQMLSKYFSEQMKDDPYILWKEEFLGKPPKKLTKKAKEKYPKPTLLRKSALIRKLGEYMFSVFGTPLYSTVATLTNVGLKLSDDDSVGEDYVKDTLKEYLTDDLKDYLKEGGE